MADKTKIEWSDASWNPVTGCTKVSPGCDHCYAETFAERFRGVPGHHFEQGFDVVLRPERLDIPLRWTKPRRVFVNSMSDLFHDAVPDEFIARVFAVMAFTQRHTFQILTKRHARLRSLVGNPEFRVRIAEAGLDHLELTDDAADWLQQAVQFDGPRSIWPLPNVWLGVSVENQQWADIRIPALLGTPAAVRFLSCEPLLGPIDLVRSINVEPLAAYHFEPGGIDWVIVGGESGRDARPMHPHWARSLRDQCTAAGVPFLFKQWGEYAPVEYNKGFLLGGDGRSVAWSDGDTPACLPDGCAVVARVGKKAAGREIDGRTWDEYPDSKPHAEIASSR